MNQRRSADVQRIVTVDASKVATTRNTGAVTTAQWRAGWTTWNLASGVMGMYSAGALVQASPSFALTQATKRFSLFGGFDLTDDLDMEGRGVGIAMSAVFPGVNIEAVPAAKTLLREMITSIAPSLTV